MQSSVPLISVLLFIWNTIGAESYDYDALGCFGTTTGRGKSINLQGTRVDDFRSAIDASNLDKTVVRPCYDLIKYNHDVLYMGIVNYSVCFSFKKGMLNREIIKQPSPKCKDRRVGEKPEL
ncbi:uncharacterized protein LOC135498052 isoform X2 [Lineus longissimus]|uniref:uncharacterized protein LOC135498052 isoform X2 n=1 Tax=Lineus longissimus TaxID=88925 RepID=UPI00315C810E